jgi:transposase
MAVGKNYFSEEQQEQLRANPYIKTVSEKAITYTRQFREKFAMDYQDGKIPSVILKDMGIDPKVIGKRRQDQIVRKMRECMQRPEGFEDTRKGSSGRPATKDLSDKEKISRLEHQIKYLKQENEYLKKIEFLDRQSEWKKKYRRRQKKNSDSSKK